MSSAPSGIRGATRTICTLTISDEPHGLAGGTSKSSTNEKPRMSLTQAMLTVIGGENSESSVLRRCAELSPSHVRILLERAETYKLVLTKSSHMGDDGITYQSVGPYEELHPYLSLDISESIAAQVAAGNETGSIIMIVPGKPAELRAT